MSLEIRQPGLTGKAVTPGSLRSSVRVCSQSSAAASNSAIPRLGMGLSRFLSRMIAAASDRLLPLCQKITEVFLVGFIVQDVIAMWVPRIGTSLSVGRQKYEPSQHPEDHALPFKQQIKKWLVENLKGLNWPNFDEESRREFATGPGLLMIPTVLYAIARRLSGKGANELGKDQVLGFGRGFADHLHQTPFAKAQQVSLEAYRHTLADYLESTFADTGMKATTLDNPALRQELMNNPVIRKMVEAEGLKAPTYGHYLKDRLRQWADITLEHIQPEKNLTDRFFDWVNVKLGRIPKPPSRHQALQPLVDEMAETLNAFNRAHRVVPYEFIHKNLEAAQKITAPVMETDKLWATYGQNAKPTQKPITGFMDELRLWSDFAGDVWKHQNAGAKTGAVSEKAKGSLVEITEVLTQKLIARKGIVALAATILGGIYLTKLAFWAQHYKSYPATRMLNAAPQQAQAVPPSFKPTTEGTRPTFSASALQPQNFQHAFQVPAQVPMPQPQPLRRTNQSMTQPWMPMSQLQPATFPMPAFSMNGPTPAPPPANRRLV
jgi:hypothetical protein